MAEEPQTNLEKAKEAAELAAAVAPLVAQFGDFLIKLIQSLKERK